MKKIVLTGGGTAGHVTPNIALIPGLLRRGYEISYVGSLNGIEKKLIEDIGIPYYGVSSGKLRRYIDVKNLSDPFRVIKGIGDSRRVLKKLDPDIVFSKGGYVAVPVVMAARLRKIPIIIHESDMTPGLANKMCFSSADRICCNFPETLKYLPPDKAIYTGSPIRAELKEGDAERAKAFCGFTNDKPVILSIGGSLGAVAINDCLRSIVPDLTKDFNIIHLCGKGNLDRSLDAFQGYVQYEYISKELPDLFAIADLVISRAGANAISEIVALAKPNLLIPLPAGASRGDQILNAESFERQGFSMVLKQEDMNRETLMNAIHKLYDTKDQYIESMKSAKQTDAVKTILDLIDECRKRR
ncbi:MAG: undecaprenyldiphospho-muramoylpentapeptide beta-N-acetylglucosaminyltransferase [Bilifractor sp.]|jgi:UDP-N-acetylglucosamine--N-acetylmuramyl-(pentapeptide) pyrophosphoryl-undecaprenol N-acetylglucosamine transferase